MSIFNHLLEYKDTYALNTIYCLRLFGGIIQPNNLIKNYVMSNNQVI